MQTHEPEIHLSPSDREMLYRQLREAANDLLGVFAGHRFPPNIHDPLALINTPLRHRNPASPARVDVHAHAIANGVMEFARALGRDYMSVMFLRTMASETENKMTRLAQVEQQALKLEKARLLAYTLLFIVDVENGGFWNVGDSTMQSTTDPTREWAPGIPRTD